MTNSSTQQCCSLIRDAKQIAVLTGAGISTSAGIPDFRGPKGLYITRQYDPETVFDIHAFHTNPEPFFDFCRDFIELEQKIKPTLTHRFIASLESMKKLEGVITQNIDALHQKAGNQNIIELHGSIWTSHCVNCAELFTYDQMKKLIQSQAVPMCACGGVIKPDIVFFGESVNHYDQAVQCAAESDLFLIIGTSLAVYPAAMIPGFVTTDIIIVNQGEVQLESPHIVLHTDEPCDKFFEAVAKNIGLSLNPNA